jgi:hypothetical protein
MNSGSGPSSVGERKRKASEDNDNVETVEGLIPANLKKPKVKHKLDLTGGDCPLLASSPRQC